MYFIAKLHLMRRTSFLLIGFLLLHIIAQSQVVKQPWSGIWTEKQNGQASIQWLFEGNDDFAEISYWANGQELGGLVRKGKFTMDTSTNTVALHFTSTFSIKDSTFSKNDNDRQVWKVVSASEEELVISRPPIWANERQNKRADGYVYVTLVRLTKPQRETAALK